MRPPLPTLVSTNTSIYWASSHDFLEELTPLQSHRRGCTPPLPLQGQTSELVATEAWSYFLQSSSSLRLCPTTVWALPWGPGDCRWALCPLIKSHRMTARRMRKMPTSMAGMMMISYCCSRITGDIDEAGHQGGRKETDEACPGIHTASPTCQSSAHCTWYDHLFPLPLYFQAVEVLLGATL